MITLQEIQTDYDKWIEGYGVQAQVDPVGVCLMYLSTLDRGYGDEDGRVRAEFVRNKCQSMIDSNPTNTWLFPNYPRDIELILSNVAQVLG